MGLNEPPEVWAPPENLDPTPVWKQYLLVAALVVLAVAGALWYALAASAPDTVRPPAVVPGDRVVLAASDHPPGTRTLVDVAGAERSFYLVDLGSELDAVQAKWSVEVGGPRSCEVSLAPAPAGFTDSCTASLFAPNGAVLEGSAPRALDRYLVTRRGDRFIVELDRPLQGVYR